MMVEFKSMANVVEHMATIVVVVIIWQQIDADDDAGVMVDGDVDDSC